MYPRCNVFSRFASACSVQFPRLRCHLRGPGDLRGMIRFDRQKRRTNGSSSTRFGLPRRARTWNARRGAGFSTWRVKKGSRKRGVASDVPATAQSYAPSASREKNRPGAPNRLKTSCGPRMQLTRSKRLLFLQPRLSYTQAVFNAKETDTLANKWKLNNRA